MRALTPTPDDIRNLPALRVHPSLPALVTVADDVDQEAIQAAAAAGTALVWLLIALLVVSNAAWLVVFRHYLTQ